MMRGGVVRGGREGGVSVSSEGRGKKMELW